MPQQFKGEVYSEIAARFEGVTRKKERLVASDRIRPIERFAFKTRN